jgi:hypothetical protein
VPSIEIGHQLPRLVGLTRFIDDEIGRHRGFRPQDNNSLRLFELDSNSLAESFPRDEVPIPPDLEPFLHERLGKARCLGAILSRVAKKTESMGADPNPTTSTDVR